MKKRILITGAAGFIGSNLIRYLLYSQNNYSVIGVDKIDNLKNIHNMYVNKSSDFYIANIHDKNIMKNILNISRPNIIINVLNNIVDTTCFLEEIADYKITNKCHDLKLIQLSNTNVYKNTDNLTEACPVAANSIDKANCITVENLINNYCDYMDVHYNILRTDNLFGPRQNVNEFIPNMFKTTKHDKITLYYKGSEKRNLTHVEDLNNSIIKIIEKGEKNQTYNVSSGFDFTDLEISFIIKECLKSNADIKFLDNAIVNKNIFYNINTDKIRSLNWKPKLSFKERLIQTVLWYNDNLWFFKN